MMDPEAENKEKEQREQTELKEEKKEKKIMLFFEKKEDEGRLKDF
ncbi:hypothetical protein Tco_1426213, partial [Tanacetum coccineum]